MFRIYSTYGRLLDCVASEALALHYLRAWPAAAFVVEVTGRGDRIVAEKEKHEEAVNQ